VLLGEAMGASKQPKVVPKQLDWGPYCPETTVVHDTAGTVRGDAKTARINSASAARTEAAEAGA